jgi:hypothetical protein
MIDDSLKIILQNETGISGNRHPLSDRCLIGLNFSNRNAIVKNYKGTADIFLNDSNEFISEGVYELDNESRESEEEIKMKQKMLR